VMAKLLQFTDRDFERFTPAEARKIKLVLYRRDFQEAVLALRKKYRVDQFQKMDGEPFALLRKWPRKNFLAVEKDVQLSCYKCDLKVGEWLVFITMLAFYNRLIPVGKQKGTVHVPTQKDIEQQIKRYAMRPEITPEDVSSAYSEIELYESDTLSAQTNDGDIVVRISPQSSMTEVRAVLPAVNKCIRFLRKQQHGVNTSDLLDIMNQVQYLSTEDGFNADQIPPKLIDYFEENLIAKGMSPSKARLRASKYNFSPAYVRKLLERARELGF